MEKTSRSAKERVADTYWPLVIHPYRTLYGPFLGRVMAQSFGCQPTSWFRADVSKMEHDNIEAFLSPAYRRRFRNIYKRAFRTEVMEARREGIDARQMARESLSQMYEGLREELSGSDIEELSNGEIKANWPPFEELEKEIHRIELNRVPKIGQLQEERNQEAEQVARDAEGAGEFFPIHSTIPGDSGTDARIRKEILGQVGGTEGYALTVADILAEAEINPLSIADSIRPGKALIRLFHLEQLEKELEAAEFAQVFRIIGRTIGKSLKLLMAPEQGRQIVARSVGKVIIGQFTDHPYSKWRKKSLENLAEKGAQLSDSHAEEWLSEMEDRSVLESSLELLPASQRKDSYFLINAHKQGKTPEGLRRELGDRKYKSKQRNFQRAVKTLVDLKKSGRLQT